MQECNRELSLKDVFRVPCADPNWFQDGCRVEGEWEWEGGRYESG